MELLFRPTKSEKISLRFEPTKGANISRMTPRTRTIVAPKGFSLSSVRRYNTATGSTKEYRTR